MQRNCIKCGVVFTTEHKQTRYCSASCRDKAARDKPSPVVNMPHLDLSIVASVRHRLSVLGALDDPMGQLALRLAEQAAGETGSALAAVSRELRATMTVVEQDARPVAADPVDELRSRRDVKRAAG